jgi:hypothetical protein
MQEKAAKQIVSSDADSSTASAETRPESGIGKHTQIVQGGLPGQGKGGD